MAAGQALLRCFVGSCTSEPLPLTTLDGSASKRVAKELCHRVRHTESSTKSHCPYSGFQTVYPGEDLRRRTQRFDQHLVSAQQEIRSCLRMKIPSTPIDDERNYTGQRDPR